MGIEWRQLPDTTYPNGWPCKEERAVVGRFSFRVVTCGAPGEQYWTGCMPGVSQTGEYDSADGAKAAIVKNVRRAFRKALAELEPSAVGPGGLRVRTGKLKVQR